MTDAEPFLADMETAAKVAEKNWGKKYSEESDEAINQLEATMNFIDIANPAAILRLVGMVRWLADEMDSNCLYSPDATIKSAYQATENT